MKVVTSAAVLNGMIGLVVLVGLDILGKAIVRAVELPVPGSIVGMLLLLALVESALLPLERVRRASNFLVKHLGLFYVPAGVAIMLYTSELRSSLVAITAAALASLVAVLFVVGFVAQRYARDE